ncbi:MAG: hypothetical protein SF051_05340 [Elusimicrobiota bacterium]|nr:hypothetical protein [Elusimicrobiota bacterium]
MDFIPEQGLAMTTVPLYLAGGELGVASAPKAYTVLVTRDRRMLIPTAELPMRIALVPTFTDPQSRWREEELRCFLEGTYDPPPPAELFARLVGVFEKYLTLGGPVEAKLLAAWTIATYLFPAWAAFGILKCEAPPASGKTRLLTLLYHTCFNAISMANVTPAAMARICVNRATGIIDEQEDLSAKRELRLILNAGYRREGGDVVRSAGRGRLAKYPVYGPRAIGSIAGLDEVLASRAIVLKMAPSADATKTSLLLDERSEDFACIRAALYSTALTRWRDVLAAKVPAIPGLSARRLEVFLPLLQVARFVDPTGAVAAEIAAFATRSSLRLPSAAALTPIERKVAEALAALPDDGQERTSSALREAVVARFPDLAVLTPAAIGLILAKHQMVTKRRTPAGALYRVEIPRVTLLARV